MYLYLQVTTSELSPPGTKHAVLMLAENENERQRWVGALNELQKLLRRNKLPFKYVSIQYSALRMTQFHLHFCITKNKRKTAKQAVEIVLFVCVVL